MAEECLECKGNMTEGCLIQLGCQAWVEIRDGVPNLEMFEWILSQYEKKLQVHLRGEYKRYVYGKN